MQMNLKQNLRDFDAFFSMLDESHAGLDRDQSGMLNSQLVQLLANHIGDMGVCTARRLPWRESRQI